MGVSFTTWARIEPNAAPVCMIGPSAPNGPPVPMAKAVASGFKIPTRIRTRLFPISTASMASGIPWPFRVGSQKWTMMPTSEAADGRYENNPCSKVIVNRISNGKRPLTIEKHIGKKVYEFKQTLRHQARR